ncbi:hypothetical protein [Novosphingobium resinovorum]|uniref:hypothetical protein n=1 Tax=Novosphingobium resinovorum TaxID=158500 RepID=UPI0022F2A2A2|nr:hypothetical protein [Novosphingobium resinovorum]
MPLKRSAIAYLFSLILFEIRHASLHERAVIDRQYTPGDRLAHIADKEENGVRLIRRLRRKQFGIGVAVGVLEHHIPAGKIAVFSSAASEAIPVNFRSHWRNRHAAGPTNHLAGAAYAGRPDQPSWPNAIHTTIFARPRKLDGDIVAGGRRWESTYAAHRYRISR